MIVKTEVYDPAADRWQTRAPLPFGSHHVAVALLNGKIYTFGGFTAPLVADRIAVHALVLVAGMIPAPGERPDDWVANTGFDQVMREHEQGDLYYHDVPRALAGQARRKTRAQSATPGHSPWPLAAWPDVPTKFVLCTEDRFFPPEFMHRLVADRLGITL